MTQVLVIDDHPIVLEGCRQLLKFAGVKRIVQTQSSPTASASIAARSRT